ncbi:MAG: hypothetical protein M3R53_10160 [Candidatus Eremiobacteraeota bacterium]|nr:hypothetical protein [Candidatus Eremiobacteraeota bacterium]
MRVKTMPTSSPTYQQTYRRPARLTDKVVLAALGFSFMIGELALAAPSHIRQAPLLLVGTAGYLVAAFVGVTLRRFGERRRLYAAARRASARWTPATREYWLTAILFANVAVVGLSAWFVALTVNAGFPVVPNLACAALAFAVFVALPGHWELAKLTAPREAPGR